MEPRRRKFYDVHHATASPIALEALERIAALFAIDSSVRGRAPEQRAAVRSKYAQPLLAQLKTFLETSLNQVSGNSALAKAVNAGEKMHRRAGVKMHQG